jgi:hypothetical protein
LNAAERRLSVSRVRENRMHGLMRQEMETGVIPTAPSPDPTLNNRVLHGNDAHVYRILLDFIPQSFKLE